MLALSLRQPWAWLILHAQKDIENRGWSTKVRGRVFIHAAKGMTSGEYDSAMACLFDIHGTLIDPPAFDALERGGIVGSVEIVNCVSASDSPWFFGPYGFVLRDPVALPFQPYRGQLSFFEVPDLYPAE